jgi:large subunit ribosomal protein L23
MAKTQTITNPVLFDIIERPVVTEKSTMGGALNKITFKVNRDADKNSIKQAVEQLFGVKVEQVNTIRQLGKQKRFRGSLGRRSDYKKAVVTLAAGENLDVMGGI